MYSMKHIVRFLSMVIYAPLHAAEPRVLVRIWKADLQIGYKSRCQLCITLPHEPKRKRKRNNFCWHIEILVNVTSMQVNKETLFMQKH